MRETIRNSAIKIYSFLFRYPEEKHVEYVLNGQLEELFQLSVSSKNPTFQKYQSWRDIYFNTPQSLLETLQVDYTRLFITAYPSVLAPPYVSYYKERSLMGQVSSSILDVYHQHGFDLNDANSEMPDHISTVLEFLYRLLETGEGDKQAHKFYTNYLKWWLPQWEDKIKKHAETPFYPLAASALVKFLAKEIS